MPPDLQQIIRALKKETCPQRVRDNVRRRISAREPRVSGLRYSLPLVIASFVLICAVVVWQWQAHESARKQARLAELTLQRAQVAQEAEDALGLVGSVLLNAGAHSEKIISEKTVPPLQASFEVAKTKITQHIDL